LLESQSEELTNEKLMEMEIQKPAEECVQPDKEVFQDIYCQVFGSGINVGTFWRNESRHNQWSRHNQFRQSIRMLCDILSSYKELYEDKKKFIQ
jgi:hypothetical protein